MACTRANAFNAENTLICCSSQTATNCEGKCMPANRAMYIHMYICAYVGSYERYEFGTTLMIDYPLCYICIYVYAVICFFDKTAS